MAQNNPQQIIDPEPISIAIAAFAAAVSAAGLIINWVNKRRDDRVQQVEEQEKQEEKLIQRQIAHSKAERVFDTLIMNYRILAKYYDQAILSTPMVIGLHAFTVYRDQADELYRLKKDFIDLGIELEKAIDELSSHVDSSFAPNIIDVIGELRHTFDMGRSSPTLGDFLVNIGILFNRIADFLDRVAEFYQIKFTLGKRDSLLGVIDYFGSASRRLS